MNEHGERKFEHEISQAELADQINSIVDELWQRYGWQCQKEIVFKEKSEKQPENFARVLQRPHSLNDENEKFVLAIFGAESGEQRKRIVETINFLIPHEVAHSVTEINRKQYETGLPQEQLKDLNSSHVIQPELFYNGANELSTDMVAYRFAVEAGKSQEFCESLVRLLYQDLQQEKTGEVKPFYRDQARFETLVNYLENQGMDFKKNEQWREVSDYWQKTRGQVLEVDDQRRYREMCDYLEVIADKAGRIPLTVEKKE